MTLYYLGLLSTRYIVIIALTYIWLQGRLLYVVKLFISSRYVVCGGGIVVTKIRSIKAINKKFTFLSFRLERQTSTCVFDYKVMIPYQNQKYGSKINERMFILRLK